MHSVVVEFGEHFLCGLIPRSNWDYYQAKFDFPYILSGQPNESEERSKPIANAIRNAFNLKIVYAPPSPWLSGDLITISKNPSLETIHIKSRSDQVGQPFMQSLRLEVHAQLRTRIKFDEAA
jgi:hypothetical protein